jgi:hypothetical protein
VLVPTGDQTLPNLWYKERAGFETRPYSKICFTLNRLSAVVYLEVLLDQREDVGQVHADFFQMLDRGHAVL